MWWIFLGGFVSFASFVNTQKTSIYCRTPCPSSESNPVCGTDMKTYASRCYLQMDRCRGHKVKMMYKGRCKAIVSTRCQGSRQRALVQRKRRLPFSIIVPTCHPDGSYVSIQCLYASRQCWCVDGIGVEIKGTRVSNRQPNCPTPSPRVPPGQAPWKFKRSENYKGCTKEERIVFNAEVIKLLEKELMTYMRRVSSVDIREITGKKGMGKDHILMWKFNQLDTNTDYFLEWRELHELLRTTKKSVPPKKCSKTFVAYCDENEDGRISRNEWYACFGVKEIKKCIGEYLAAVKSSQQLPTGRLYLPRCQSDGSFVPTQCFAGIGYCWCVDSHSGKPIPGTTKKTNVLDCRRYVPSPSGVQVGRPRGKKECTSEIWPIYKRQLVNIFRKEVIATKIKGATPDQLAESLIRSQRRARSGNLGAWGTFLSNNQILTWKFHQLDTNKNRLLVSSEYFVPSIKRILGRIKRGRKCSRKLLTNCDLDKNGGLSLAEWSYCLSSRYQRHLS